MAFGLWLACRVVAVCYRLCEVVGAGPADPGRSCGPLQNYYWIRIQQCFWGRAACLLTYILAWLGLSPLLEPPQLMGQGKLSMHNLWTHAAPRNDYILLQIT